MSLVVRDVIARAMRLNGSLASGDMPMADELTDALEAFNTMQRAWFGTIIGPRLTAQSATGSSAQAENGGEYMIPGAAFTLTAPAGPRAGARFGAVDATLDFATHNLTVDPNGRLIEGAAANLVISANGDNRRWWFRGDVGGWVREADYTDPSDAISFPDSLIAYMPYMLAVVLASEFNTELRADVLAGNAEGREAFARAYGRRGRNSLDAPIGVGSFQALQQGQGR
jgi:hypothetical protein